MLLKLLWLFPVCYKQPAPLRLNASSLPTGQLYRICSISFVRFFKTCYFITGAPLSISCPVSPGLCKLFCTVSVLRILLQVTVKSRMTPRNRCLKHGPCFSSLHLLTQALRMSSAELSPPFLQKPTPIGRIRMPPLWRKRYQDTRLTSSSSILRYNRLLV